jgi:hypothetical protein
MVKNYKNNIKIKLTKQKNIKKIFTVKKFKKNVFIKKLKYLKSINAIISCIIIQVKI